jgi:hypothetical protein
LGALVLAARKVGIAAPAQFLKILADACSYVVPAKSIRAASGRTLPQAGCAAFQDDMMWPSLHEAFYSGLVLSKTFQSLSAVAR